MGAIRYGFRGSLLVVGYGLLQGCQGIERFTCSCGEDPGDTAVFRKVLEPSGWDRNDSIQAMVRIPAGFRPFGTIQQWARTDTLFLRPSLLEDVAIGAMIGRGSYDTVVRFGRMPVGSSLIRWVRYWIRTDRDEDSLVVQEMPSFSVGDSSSAATVSRNGVVP